jgi:transcriptional regulator with XRE-family HTH domain
LFLQAKYTLPIVVCATIHAYRCGVMTVPDYRERFANRLRSRREAAGLSIEKASEQGGLSPNFWGSVERMAQEPCLDSISGFAKGLGISVRTLMTLEGDDAQDTQREELNAILDLLTPEQLVLTLKISKLIYNYKTEDPPRSEPQ